MNRSVILKDRNGNNCYPKTIASNVIGIAKVLEDGRHIYFGEGYPLKDKSSFVDIELHDIYIDIGSGAGITYPSSNFFVASSFYGQDSNIITWDNYGTYFVAPTPPPTDTALFTQYFNGSTPKIGIGLKIYALSNGITYTLSEVVGSTLYWKSDDIMPAQVKRSIYNLLNNATYKTPYNSNDVNIIEEWAGSCEIINNLKYCTTSNQSTNVFINDSYTATITPNSGYVIDTVSIVMNGEDITSTAYNNGVINVEHVTGNLHITINAVIDWTNGFTLTADKFTNGGLNENYPPLYVNTEYAPNFRTSYGRNEIVIEPGYEYTVTYDADTTQSIGVHQVNTRGYEAIENNIAFSRNDKNDSGWKSSGYKFTAFPNINGLSAKCIWITFNNNKQSMGLRSVTITREAVN